MRVSVRQVEIDLNIAKAVWPIDAMCQSLLFGAATELRNVRLLRFYCAL
jgi:hypothetical protein